MQLLILALLPVFTNVIYATEYGRALASPGNGEIIPLDISLQNNSMLIYPGQPQPPQECFKQSLNFHDFDKGLVAIKVVDKGVCWIKESSETYEEVHALLDQLKRGGAPAVVNQTTEEWSIPEFELNPSDVESTAGARIANFCSGYKVYIMKDGRVVTHVDDLVARRVQQRKASCFVCMRCSGIVKA